MNEHSSRCPVHGHQSQRGTRGDHSAASRPRLRASRAGAAGLFLVTGLVFATWAARIPARKTELGLSDTDLAVAFIGLNAGAVAGLQLGAVIVTRLGGRRVLGVTLPVFAGMLVPIAYSGELVTLTVALAVSAVANSVVDVAINDQGVQLQQAYGRPVLSGLHAMHSVGGVSGGAIAAVAAFAGVSVNVHFILVAALTAVIALLASRLLLPPAETGASPSSGDPQPGLLSGWSGRLLALGSLAFVCTMAESTGLNWSAVLLHDSLNSSAAFAAATLAAFQAAVTLGRLIGDRAVHRSGPVLVFRVSALLAGSGLGVGLYLGNPWSALVGFSLLGFGLANLLPICIGAAGTAGRLPVPVAVARVSALGYLGSFVGPALIGALAHAADLTTALGLPALAVAATGLAAAVVRFDRPAASRRIQR